VQFETYRVFIHSEISSAAGLAFCLATYSDVMPAKSEWYHVFGDIEALQIIGAIVFASALPLSKAQQLLTTFVVVLICG
jgi:hypothetical protein